jgi:hydroxyacylglutathione hydrolase
MGKNAAKAPARIPPAKKAGGNGPPPERNSENDAMSLLDIRIVRCRTDNYAFIVHDPDSGRTMVVDTPEFGPIDAELQKEGWGLDLIVNTHHHQDHVDANLALKEKYGAEVLGPKHDAERIPGLDRGLRDGDGFSLGEHRFDVIAVPGHTMGHLAYYICDQKAVFTGDTLFSLGCGRMFEGDAEQMWHSLDLFRHLPDETRLYCGHEYTLANAAFALTVEPGNEALRKRAEEVRKLRADGLPTLPSTIALEKATNPFLRPDSMEIRENLGMTGVENYRVFGELRAMKDNFKG